MADEHGEHGGGDNTIFVVIAVLAVLFALSYVNGSLKDIQPGIFIKPLPPTGSGAVYGPEITDPTQPSTTTNQY